ncbi:MAG: iron chaperone [Firmicutes bacterium]|nr:iron chaperone [Bacillota bacterium]
MKTFGDFLAQIGEPEKRKKLELIFQHLKTKFPHLQEEIKWNQPMFTDHGTFIIAFSVAKGHISVAPEEKTISLFRIKWTDEIDFDLLDRIVAFNIEDKQGMDQFWR